GREEPVQSEEGGYCEHFGVSRRLGQGQYRCHVVSNVFHDPGPRTPLRELGSRGDRPLSANRAHYLPPWSWLGRRRPRGHRWCVSMFGQVVGGTSRDSASAPATDGSGLGPW